MLGKRYPPEGSVASPEYKTLKEHKYQLSSHRESYHGVHLFFWEYIVRDFEFLKTLIPVLTREYIREEVQRGYNPVVYAVDAQCLHSLRLLINLGCPVYNPGLLNTHCKMYLYMRWRDAKLVGQT